ncbi:hypothetical protein HYPSUDRAFT_89271 [Hypholoma sublateritium FD-334 SS-4]|uniref:DUF6534 domain-containing protein n=1 Tax=Hypholoma sublateritium (strain FD-334 SS-4) TaxID=945553 RepID=A0A0D2PI48_HYPSF|nr:hypothetical protein HYPSUDRAFT_89271 [Hypholoma sublateritium FD-334 SS-4]
MIYTSPPVSNVLDTTPTTGEQDRSLPVLQLLACSFAATLLWGVACAQFLHYLLHVQRMPNHSKPILFLVRSSFGRYVLYSNQTGKTIHIWIASTVHSVLMTTGIWKLIDASAHSVEIRLEVPPIELLVSFILRTVVTVSTEAYFSLRLYRLGGFRKRISFFLLPLLLLQIVGGLVYLVYINEKSRRYTIIKVLQMAIIAASGAADIVICIAKSAQLWRRYLSSQQSGAQIERRLDIIVRKSIFLSLNTGSWTAVISIVVLILLITQPHSSLYLAISFLIAPLQCITFLASISFLYSVRRHRNESPATTSNNGDNTFDSRSADPVPISENHPSSRTAQEGHIRMTNVLHLPKQSQDISSVGLHVVGNSGDVHRQPT